MDSVAFLINEHWIFRFPKHQDAKDCLKKEIKALPILKNAVNVAIPDFTFIDSEANFVGYQKINGEFLTKELFYSFSEKGQNQTLKSLAEFLTTVHNQDVEIYQKCGVETQDFRESYAEDFEAIKTEVYPLFSSEDCEYISEQFKLYLERDENFSYQPVLLHNDFSGDHILIDSATKNLSGVIDFGDIAIGDGDYDLMYLLDDFGEDFVKSFLKFYPSQNHNKLLAKLYFWGLVDTLQLILHYLEEKEFDEIEELVGYAQNWIQTMSKRAI